MVAIFWVCAAVLKARRATSVNRQTAMRLRGQPSGAAKTDR